MSQFGAGYGRPGRNQASALPDVNPTLQANVTGIEQYTARAVTTRANTQDLDDIVAGMRAAAGAVESGARFAAGVGRRQKARLAAQEGAAQDDADAAAFTLQQALDNNLINPRDDQGNVQVDIEAQMIDRMDEALTNEGFTGLDNVARQLASNFMDAELSGVDYTDEQREAGQQQELGKATSHVLTWYNTQRENTRDVLKPSLVRKIATGSMEELREYGLRSGSGTQGVYKWMDTDGVWLGAPVEQKREVLIDAIAYATHEGDFKRARMLVEAVRIDDASVGRAEDRLLTQAIQRHNEGVGNEAIETFVSGASTTIDVDGLRAIAAATEGDATYISHVSNQLASAPGLDAERDVTKLLQIKDDNGDLVVKPYSPAYRAIRQALASMPSENDKLAEIERKQANQLSIADGFNATMLLDGQLKTQTFEDGTAVTKDNYRDWLREKYGTQTGDMAYSSYMKAFNSQSSESDSDKQEMKSAEYRSQIRVATSESAIQQIQTQASRDFEDGFLSASGFNAIVRDSKTEAAFRRVQLWPTFKEFVDNTLANEAYAILGVSPAVTMNQGFSSVAKMSGNNRVPPGAFSQIVKMEEAVSKEWRTWYDRAQVSVQTADGVQLIPVKELQISEDSYLRAEFIKARDRQFEILQHRWIGTPITTETVNADGSIDYDFGDPNDDPMINRFITKPNELQTTPNELQD